MNYDDMPLEMPSWGGPYSLHGETPSEYPMRCILLHRNATVSMCHHSVVLQQGYFNSDIQEQGSIQVLSLVSSAHGFMRLRVKITDPKAGM